MNIEMPETSELQALVAVVHAGSVSGAARESGLPRATISRRLSRLEDRLGVRLVRRTTRRLQLTEAGDELYAHARTIVGAVELAARAVQLKDEAPRGLLRVSVPPLDNNSFRDLLLEFSQQYPQVQLEVISTTRHQDLIADNIDVAWRAGPTLDPGLIARRLAVSQRQALASPAYLARRGAPQSPEALQEHDCLVGFLRGERPTTHWPLLAGGKIRVRAKLASNDLPLLLRGALRGLGIAMLPDVVSASHKASGALIPVLADQVGGVGHVSLVFQERHLMKPSVRAFLDFTVAWWEQNSWRPPSGT